MAYKLTFMGTQAQVRASQMVSVTEYSKSDVVCEELVTIALQGGGSNVSVETNDGPAQKNNFSSFAIRGPTGKILVDFARNSSGWSLEDLAAWRGRLWISNLISGHETIDHNINDGFLSFKLKFDPAATTSSVSQSGTIVTLTAAPDLFPHFTIEGKFSADSSNVLGNGDRLIPGQYLMIFDSGGFTCPGYSVVAGGHGNCYAIVPCKLEEVI